LNILVITNHFYPENFKINDLVDGLTEKGHKIRVVTQMPNYPSGNFHSGFHFFGPLKERHPKGHTIYRVPVFPRLEGKNWQLVFNYLSYALFSSFFVLFLLRKPVDKIFVYETSPMTVGIPALVFKFFKRIPLYFWITDLWPESLMAVGAVKNKVILKLVEWMVKFIYHHCDYILMASQAFKTSILKFGVPEKKLLYFPQWAEEYYRPLTEDPKLSQFVGHENFFKLMFAGNIGEAQSFETLTQAANILKEEKNIHWYILGNGRRKAWANEEIIRLGLQSNFHFLGSFPPEKMSEFFYYADGLIVSLKKAEIFALTIPAKVQAYLACEKPILASLDGEGARIIEEANAGFTSESENAAALAQNILQLQNSTQKKNGRQYFEKNFSRALLLSKIESWLISSKPCD